MTSVTQVGTPNATVYTTTSGTNTPTISWSGTQPRNAGDILVLVVNASAITSVTLPTAPGGWQTAYNLGNTATTPHALTACFYTIAAGGDAAPSISVVTSGTTRCGFQLFELTGGDSAHPVDTSGTYASGATGITIASWSFATSGNIAAAGEYVIASYAREQATAVAATFATTDGSTLFTTSSAESSSRDHDMVSYLASPPAGSAFTASGTVTSAATSFAAGGVAAFQIGPAPYSGGPQGWSSPAGVRAVYMRTGLAMASLIPLPVSSSPVILTTSLPEGTVGQPYTATLAASGGTLPYTWSISSGSLPGWATLNTSTGAITGTVTGPPAVTSFTVKVTDAHSSTATQPLSVTITAAPVIPSGPARARITPPPRGRIWSNPGGPVQNPPPPPPPAIFRPQGAVRAKVPQPYPRRGQCRTIRFLPVQGNPQGGPAFYPAVQPVRARIPQVAPRGRAGGNKGILAVRPVVTGPPVYPLQGPVKAKLPQQPLLRGRIASNPGGPVRNPQPGPVFRQAVHPVAARLPVPFLKGRASGNPGGPLRNPGSGSVFRQAVHPARAVIPQVFGKGRASGNPGTPVAVPPPLVIPPFRPQGTVQAKLPPPRRGTCRAIRFLPVQLNPQQGPAFIQAASPARIRPGLPPRGRISGNKGAPVPPPPIAAPFRLQASPARIRPGLPPRGRVNSGPGAPLRNPQAGPAFRQAASPSRIRPSLPPRGRAGSNPGGPVPPPPIVAIFQQATSPALARIPQNAPRGRVYSHLGAPLRNPEAGPVFRQAVRPVQARQPLPPRGRIASSPGGPVRNPVFPAPVYPLHSPVQARFPLPPRGRTGSNPGTLPPPPPVPAKVYPAQGPVRIRITLPPRGRIASGKGAPVRNPQPGPVFRQAVHPVRPVIPQNAPRGRTSGNPGGPVANIPFAALKFRTGSPYFQWDTEDPGFQWETSSPGFQWATGDPEAG